jgi:hypothetical protein
MLRRITNLLAYGSGPIARRLTMALPAPRAARAALDPSFRMLMVVGDDHVMMAREGLRSLVRTWRAVPPLVLVSDGSLSPRDVDRALGWYPAPMEVRERDAIIASAATEGGPDLAAFAAAAYDCAGTTAFALKFAAAVLEAKRQPVLLSDADILWFRDFGEEVRRLRGAGAGVVIRTMRDYQKSYDGEIETLFQRFGAAARAPYVNAGLVYLSGDLLGAVDLTPALRIGVQPGHYFAEQTIFALAAAALGAEPWDHETVACFQADEETFGVTYRRTSWYARHYVAPVRHLFWRDALALRLGVAP